MEDHTSVPIDLTQYDTHGFCPGYRLRRHLYESLANAGCREARQDWIQYIGPVSEFGNYNPVNGNFTANVLPICKPERLKLVAYILEYAFLHDSVVELVTPASAHDGDAFSLGERESTRADMKSGRKQLQAKMMLQLLSTDKVCAERVLDVWKTMLSTTREDKFRDFSTLEEYLDFRIVDTGAPFVEAVMLFGMGMTLTTEEDAQLADVVRPCFAALALANDYFSFDKEWKEAQEPGASKPLNAVWLNMQWNGVDIAIAKKIVRDAANRYERSFLERCDNFRSVNAPIPEKLDLYLRGMAYQVSGNVVWSLNCPRYYPEFRYDPNAGIEDVLTARHRGALSVHEEQGEDDLVAENGPPTAIHHRHSIASTDSYFSESDLSDSCWSQISSRSSSISEADSYSDDAINQQTKIILPADGRLGLELVDAPVNYVSSLPSKVVRGTFIDALNLWAGLSDETLSKIKEVVDHLHNASLLFDDIEDGSELRRGCPAAHTVFGIPQTVNAASFAVIEAVRRASEISIPGAVGITLEQLRDLHIGQSYDIHWTRHTSCPTEDEYLEMVSKKTGGLFRLLSRLMSTDMSDDVRSEIDSLVSQVGIYFQIRDDYQNLNSDEYANQKGFCEDLDEGKLSFPLVRYLNTAKDTLQVREVMQQRRTQGCLSLPLKRLVLQQLGTSNCLDYTRTTLERIAKHIDESLWRLESLTGKRNWVLRLCMEKLRV
ncbi:isoprenoid synthase domain-containing protein [Cladorrhinum sp. PSN259]|nr:isoprenoid synthase domain-containing protein [Cladorrhinum sp. PSN259]